MADKPKSNPGGMPDDEMNRPRPTEEISEGARTFVGDVVERALAELGDDADPALRREVLTETLVETLHDIVARELERREAAAAGNGNGVAATNGAFAIGDTAGRGMEVAKGVKELGFVEFTTGLVTGVFDTLTASTLKQMEGYSKLVSEIASSLSEFAAENVSPADVEAHLSTKYPDGNGGTVVHPLYTFPDTPADDAGNPGKTGVAKLREVANSILLATDDLPQSRKLTEAGLALEEDQVSFTIDQVRAIRVAFTYLLASDMREQLREMVREGMARIVVTDGELLTKLTFRMTTTEIAAKQQSKYHVDSAGAHINGQAGTWWGSVQAGGYWNQVNVSTVNEQTFDSATMSAEMIGQVKIRFKTESFPPREIATPTES